MLFGSEPPLCLRRVGHRGLRRHEADVLQHPPGYLHPLSLLPPTNTNTPPGSVPPPYALYAASPLCISEAHRLHPTLTTAAELQHARQVEAQQRQRWTQARRHRHKDRVAQLEKRREEEFQREQQRGAQMAGVSMRNETGDGRDTITRVFRLEEARRRSEDRSAVEQHSYFLRQQKLMQRRNPHGYNIITGEPLRPIVVPPLPTSTTTISLPPVNNV
ncbi:Variant surface glycoprotein [Trypanosoma theileri]|uniref:Variant surface glycoprotein n=1 Tax=Trypanosoma theileri TaxID=67003 RepID=A0A1X0NR64_9TRYP|nr:Variant surface glycoprotein [Trypanosoma theileri]ORC87184.1 Variant surface glycoprotein [Trypanosoma theileri]